jgi:hypothetical protein
MVDWSTCSSTAADIFLRKGIAVAPVWRIQVRRAMHVTSRAVRGGSANLDGGRICSGAGATYSALKYLDGGEGGALSVARSASRVVDNLAKPNTRLLANQKAVFHH